MAYWLLKSEPDCWSWDQQKREGKKGAEWDGVRNFQARNHMRAMKKGDLGFFYETGDAKQAVGIVKISKEARPDSTDEAWEAVDVVLVRNSRLSVQPVSPREWSIVCKLGGLAKPPGSSD